MVCKMNRRLKFYTFSLLDLPLLLVCRAASIDVIQARTPHIGGNQLDNISE